jgi:hypothetical protein
MDINDEHVVSFKILILILQSWIFKSIFLYLLKFCAECNSCNQHQGGHHYVCVFTMSYVCLQLGVVAFRVPSLSEIEVNNWFSILFLLMEYYNSCWPQNFQMRSKETLFVIVDCLRPLIQKQDTCNKLFIPMEVCITCALYNIAQGCNLWICNELIAVG